MEYCIVCSTKLYLLWEKNKHKIYKCPKCGLGATYDSIPQGDKYHRDEIYIDEEDFFNNIFLKRVNILTKLMKPGRVLEVGCSTGLMLELLKKRGWEVKGVEVSKKALEVARSKGIDVTGGYFENISFSEKFDLIIFNHTLEHMQNPKKVLEKASNLLSKQGYLYIDLPNFDSIGAKFYKASWQLLLPQEHIWHFTESSLRILMGDLCFKIIYIEKASGIWNSQNPALEVWLSLIRLKKRFFNQIITAFPSWIISKINQGSDLMVIAKKEK